MTSAIKGIAPIKQSNLSEESKLRGNELQELGDDKRNAVSGKHTDRSGWWWVLDVFLLMPFN
jgi:hypothetical protein